VRRFLLGAGAALDAGLFRLPLLFEIGVLAFELADLVVEH
jgi:hypothetical protein